MNESDENAQQRSYYSPQRLDSQYWWSFFIFLLDAAILNAFELWQLQYLLGLYSVRVGEMFQINMAEVLEGSQSLMSAIPCNRGYPTFGGLRTLTVVYYVYLKRGVRVPTPPRNLLEPLAISPVQDPQSCSRWIHLRLWTEVPNPPGWATVGFALILRLPH